MVQNISRSGGHLIQSGPGSEFQSLKRLFGGYLGQDWAMQHETTRDAVAAFAKAAPPRLVAGAINELGVLIPRVRNLESPDAVLFGLGCFCRSGGTGAEAADWLETVRQDLQQSTC